MNQKGFAPILIVLILAALVGGYFVYSDKIGVYQNQTKPTPSTQPTTQPSPTSDPTANWKTYTNNKYNYSIAYPQDAQIIRNEREDFKIFIKGEDYPLGTYVAVDVIQNPKKLTLKKLGNERFATDAPEPYDLNWKETQFLGMIVLSTKYQPPGDTGEQTIYLFEKNNIVYALWKNPVDQPNSIIFEDLSTQILSTFKFLD